MEILLEIGKEALMDSVRMLPFLFGAYLLMEYLEHRSSEKMELLLAGAHRLGPLTGALLGCVPQCGFSVAAANLYAGRVITAGTLLAVFLSTSDEAIPLLLSDPERAGLIGQLLLYKVLIAVAAGTVADLVLRLLGRQKVDDPPEIEELCQHCGCGEGGIFSSALRHTLEIFGFILLVNLVLGGCVELLGQEGMAQLLMQDSVFQPVVAGILGLIPNCAASVLLTRLYMAGTVSFGALMAGLCTSAGVGLAVLLRANRRPKENIILLITLCGVGITAGILLQLAGVGA